MAYGASARAAVLMVQMRWLPVALVGVGIALVNFTLINLISATMAYRFETAMAYLEERGKRALPRVAALPADVRSPSNSH